MTVPVTTGGKRGSKRLKNGAIRMVTAPAIIVEPRMPRTPRSGLAAIAAIGLTAAKVTPIMTGIRMPNARPRPSDWISVAMPAANRSALTSSATCSGGSFRARPMMSGTATAPAYMTSTCCRPSASSFGAGRTSSTGWTELCMDYLHSPGSCLGLLLPCEAPRPRDTEP